MIFNPVLALMDRAKYVQKFSIIFIVFMLPYGWLSLDKIYRLYEAMERYHLELQGLEAIEKILPVYKSALELAGLKLVFVARKNQDVTAAIDIKQQQYLSEVSELNAWLASSVFFQQGIDAQVESRKPTGSQSSDLDAYYVDRPKYMKPPIEAINQVARVSGLSQDGDPEVSRDVKFLLSEALAFYDDVSMARSYAGYVTAYGYILTGARSSIASQPHALQRFIEQKNAAGNSAARSALADAAKQAQAIFKKGTIDVYMKGGSYKNWADRWLAKLNEFSPVLAAHDRALEQVFAGVRENLQVSYLRAKNQLWIWSLSLLGAILVLVYLFMGFFLSVRKSLYDIMAGMHLLAEGDLRHLIHTPARDELGDLSQAFNTAQLRVRDLLSEVAKFSSSTQSKARVVNESAAASQASVAQQAAELEHIVVSMSQMVSSVQEVSRYSQVTADKASKAGARCNEGRAQINRAVTGMQNLFNEMDCSINAVTAVEKESLEITKALAMIKSVSEQTDLLALNAAIEAARAGDHGRGFAVVADEVRVLATRSHKLAGEINATLERLSSHVDSAVRTIRSSHLNTSAVLQEVTDTACLLEEITQGMGQIIDHNVQIATAAEQQASVVEGVERNAQEVKALSVINGSAASNTVQVSDEMADMTRNLHALVGKFKMPEIFD